MIKDIWVILKDYAKLKHKPSISNIFHFTNGILGFFCIISSISPFEISASILDDINWNANLTPTDTIVVLTFLSLIFHLLVCIIRKIIVCAYQEKTENQIRQVYSFIYTIEDIVDLISSVLTFVFIFAVFLQMYKTGKAFLSWISGCVYIMIAVRFLSFIGGHFRVRNLEIINDVLKKY